MIDVLQKARGILLFIWLCRCPIYRYHLSTLMTNLFCCGQRCCAAKDEKEKERREREKRMQALLADTYESYDSLNSFLFSSLNMEMVYAILKGVNVVLREINGVDPETRQIMKQDVQGQRDHLSEQDFLERKEIHLKKINIFKREFFEKATGSEMRRGLLRAKNGNNDTSSDKAEELAKSILSDKLPQTATTEEKRKELFEEVAIDVRVKSYAPRVFRFLRAIDGIDEYDVM